MFSETLKTIVNDNQVLKELKVKAEFTQKCIKAGCDVCELKKAVNGLSELEKNGMKNYRENRKIWDSNQQKQRVVFIMLSLTFSGIEIIGSEIDNGTKVRIESGLKIRIQSLPGCEERSHVKIRIEKEIVTDFEHNYKSCAACVDRKRAGCAGGRLGLRHVQLLYVATSAALLVACNQAAATALPHLTGLIPGSAHAPTYDWTGWQCGLFLSSAPVGHALARAGGVKGGRRVLMGALLVAGSFLIALPAIIRTGDWMWACAARALIGVAGGALIPTTRELLSRWLPPHERSFIAPLIYYSNPAGAAVTLSACAVLGTSAPGWPLTMYLPGAFALGGFTLLLCLTSDAPHSLQAISEEERDYIVSHICMQPQIKFEIPWRQILSSRAAWAAAFGQLCCELPHWLQLYLMPIYLTRVLHYSYKQSASLCAVAYAMGWVVAGLRPRQQINVFTLNLTPSLKFLHVLAAANEVVGSDTIGPCTARRRVRRARAARNLIIALRSYRPIRLALIFNTLKFEALREKTMLQNMSSSKGGHILLTKLSFANHIRRDPAYTIAYKVCAYAQGGQIHVEYRTIYHRLRSLFSLIQNEASVDRVAVPKWITGYRKIVKEKCNNFGCKYAITTMYLLWINTIAAYMFKGALGTAACLCGAALGGTHAASVALLAPVFSALQAISLVDAQVSISVRFAACCTTLRAIVGAAAGMLPLAAAWVLQVADTSEAEAAAWRAVLLSCAGVVLIGAIVFLLFGFNEFFVWDQALRHCKY
ncbi:hypothetical protein EVAR_99222_1 [Eumeta japonica]|uniref:Inorganic phosphate cotransporter n=1 Tax=Eumeta variegata TaxID=151549 RepID=A0A4C1YL78_EUMVA|nr:hypothetical protein EVAR_99222_1 [Eumeta japonica]